MNSDEEADGGAYEGPSRSQQRPSSVLSEDMLGLLSRAKERSGRSEDLSRGISLAGSGEKTQECQTWMVPVQVSRLRTQISKLNICTERNRTPSRQVSRGDP